ncbi:YueH family protein [Jeotgalibacillus sp. ET6]|uniref:YueH family protein n=1 Tax=Jeotgalibacillus sp. ET6 TaxID=3037260 RepID=UPI0024189370|nr:YueH family protein [Jeotgalibacillus sp. ET6]MDG5473065.1 YueH family protein [Jeotgalibacillus sp. ET6]
MKIRRSISGTNERKVFIHENKKEETILVAIPTLSWSAEFTYDELGEELNHKLKGTLQKTTDAEESAEIAQRISQWTNEM